MSATLIVEADEVARRLGVGLPLGEDDRWTIEAALRDAQADVEAYLGRPITVRQFVEAGRTLYPRGFRLRQSPVVELLSLDDPQGPFFEQGAVVFRYTVTYRAGLDAGNPAAGEWEPIHRYVRTAAMYAPEVQRVLRERSPEAARKITSATVTGQSVTWTDTYSTAEAKAGSGVPGSLPTLASLDRWKRTGRRVYVRPSLGPVEPWPYGRDIYF